MATIRVPLSDGTATTKEGFVYWYTLPDETRIKLFIQDAPDPGGTACVLVDYRSGQVIGKLGPYLLPIMVQGYALTRNVKRLAADNLMHNLINRQGLAHVKTVISEARPINGPDAIAEDA